MKQIIIGILLSMSLGLSAEDNYIFLGLDDFYMSRTDQSGLLKGSVTANKVHFMYDDQNIEVNGNEHQPYIAETILTKDRLVFNNSFLKFSTPLESDNPLYLLDSIKASNSDIEINTAGALITSDYLDFSLSNMLIAIKHANLDCVSDIGFTMNVDEICLKNSTISKKGEKPAVVEIKSVDHPTKASMSIDLNRIKVEPFLISATANNITGRYEDSEFILTQGFLTCAKLEERDLDPESFLRGCLTTAQSKAKSIRFKGSLYDIEVEEAHLNIEESKYHLDAAYSHFETGDQRTMASKFRLDCLKLPVTPDSVDTNRLLKGCFTQGELYIGNLDPDNTKLQDRDLRKQTLKDIIDTDNLKDIELNFDDSRFFLSAKSKIVVRLKFKVRGRTEWNEDRTIVKFHIEKASVASFPATSMTMKILAKFINSDSMSIDGNTITIKF